VVDEGANDYNPNNQSSIVQFIGATKPSHVITDQVKEEGEEFTNSAAAIETRPSASYVGTFDNKHMKSGYVNST